MATYIKTIKDAQGNQILPRTWSTAVTMADGETTLDDALASKVNNADYQYQAPVISGTQIRIVQQSAADKRLYFKLAADLSGGAITISLDGGATSKPLQDVDGNAITQLDKGYTEVIADATFFTLRSRGISGTQKQALIDIVNAAEANDSTIKTNIVTELNSVSTDNSLGLTASSAWADIQAKIPSVKTGKKWASGQITLTWNGTNWVGTVSGVSGFNFVPTTIIATSFQNGQNYVIYQSSGLLKDNSGNGINLWVDYGSTNSGSGGVINVANGTFSLKMYIGSNGSPTNPCYWVAFE